MITSRLYRDENDLKQMLELLMAARSRADDWHYWHVGDLVWGYFMVVCRVNPHQVIRLWHDSDKLVGYTILGGDDVYLQWQVLPEYEWRGIEAEALEWAELRLAELRQSDPKLWGGNVITNAPKDDVKRIAFLEQHGFKHEGHTSVNFLRPLIEPIPEPVLADGCIVRGVGTGADEISNRAAAARETWYPYSVGKVSDDDYARLMRLPMYERDLDVVTVAPDGVMAAYAMCWLDPVNRIGDFGPVGARPAYRRRGLTRAALIEGLRRMQARGMNRACVSTQETNTPALNLYESVGFKQVHKYLDYVKPSGASHE